MTNKFKIGDRVAWVGKANGGLKTHEGVVVAVIPQGATPRHVWPRLCKMLKDGGYGYRQHVSYLVSERSRVHWPVVTGLRALPRAEPCPSDI